jgi:hypothetical protein
MCNNQVTLKTRNYADLSTIEITGTCGDRDSTGTVRCDYCQAVALNEAPCPECGNDTTPGNMYCDDCLEWAKTRWCPPSVGCENFGITCEECSSLPSDDLAPKCACGAAIATPIEYGMCEKCLESATNTRCACGKQVASPQTDQCAECVVAEYEAPDDDKDIPRPVCAKGQNVKSCEECTTDPCPLDEEVVPCEYAAHTPKYNDIPF